MRAAGDPATQSRRAARPGCRCRGNAQAPRQHQEDACPVQRSANADRASCRRGRWPLRTPRPRPAPSRRAARQEEGLRLLCGRAWFPPGAGRPVVAGGRPRKGAVRKSRLQPLPALPKPESWWKTGPNLRAMPSSHTGRSCPSHPRGVISTHEGAGRTWQSPCSSDREPLTQHSSETTAKGARPARLSPPAVQATGEGSARFPAAAATGPKQGRAAGEAGRDAVRPSVAWPGSTRCSPVSRRFPNDPSPLHDDTAIS